MKNASMPSTAAIASIASSAARSSIIAMQVTCVSCAAMCSAKGSLAEAAGARGVGKAATAAAVAAGGGDRRAPSRRCRRAGRGCRWRRSRAPRGCWPRPGSPTRTMPRCWTRARAEHHHVDRVAVERRVLLVDDHEVEAEHAEDLGRVRGRRLDERAEQVLARPQAAAEIGVGRSGVHRFAPHRRNGTPRHSALRVVSPCETGSRPRRFPRGVARGSSVTASSAAAAMSSATASGLRTKLVQSPSARISVRRKLASSESPSTKPSSSGVASKPSLTRTSPTMPKPAMK